MAIISIIAAMSENRAIGKDNKLPWYIPEDLAWFKEKTRGKPVIMGRKTHESIGKRLPGRLNIVISRDKDYVSPIKYVYKHNSLEDAIKKHEGLYELMIIGGSELYKAAIPLANRMYLTRICANFEGDTFFPEYDESEWEEKEHIIKGTMKYMLHFHVLERTGG